MLKAGWVVLDGSISSIFLFLLFLLFLTRLKMSMVSHFMSSMFFAIKGVDSSCSTESLFGSSSDKSVRAIKAEPQVERVCSGEGNGIMIEEPGRVVCQVVAGGTSCLLFPATSMLSSKEPKGLSILKSFGIKCILGIRSL